MSKTSAPGKKLGIVWAPEALRQVELIKAWRDRQHAKKYLGKIQELVEDAREQPFHGLGKPEPLKYKVPPCWSRRINIEDRLVYRVNKGDLEIISVLGHYTK